MIGVNTFQIEECVFGPTMSGRQIEIRPLTLDEVDGMDVTIYNSRFIKKESFFAGGMITINNFDVFSSIIIWETSFENVDGGSRWDTNSAINIIFGDEDTLRARLCNNVGLNIPADADSCSQILVFRDLARTDSWCLALDDELLNI